MPRVHTQAQSVPLAALTSPAAAGRAELLLGRCALHDEQALRELYELMGPLLFGLLLRMLRRRAVAEEALQDVMVRIWQRAGQYDTYRGRAIAWMTSIARYRAIDLLRTQRATASLDEAPDEAFVDVSAADLVDGTTPERLRKALRDCFGLLSDEQRRCLALAYVDGYSQDQIADVMGSPLGTVKSWMRRGLASLRRCLDS